MKQFFLSQAASTAILAAGITALVLPAQAQSAAAPQLAASSELVTNGGFENDNGGDGNYFAGWTLSGNADDTSAFPNTFVFGDPHSGDLDAWLGPNGSDGFLTQSILTTPGQAYTVSYWLASDSPAATAISTPGLSPLDDPTVFNDFSASFGGQTLFSQTNLASVPGPPDPSDYTLYSFTAVATSAASTLNFGFRNDGSYFHLDDVSITPAAVPEASTTLSLGLLLALGGVTVIARRKRSVNTAVSIA